ncbi:MAG: ATP-grasp domain-containing protein [Flammeovirgaceae bacterium]
MAERPLTFLCVSCYFKGADFLTACKELGNKVFLVTAKKLEHKPWPREHIDEIFYVEEDEDQAWNMDQVIDGLAYFMRANKVDRMVALDDFDVEKVTHLREHFRMPGMGQTTGRHFRDKLAMRVKAQESGIAVPAFCGLFNDAEINEFADTVPAPWLVKPRGEASATGITKVHNKEELWNVIHGLGDKRHNYLVERFAPGDVYHIDSISHNGKIVFTRVSKYLDTPMEVAHGGGIFRSHMVEFGGEDDKALQKLNTQVMKAFGMRDSASHSEFIKSKETGEFFFLETASRVGGAHIVEMVEAGSGVNLWKEWARLETMVTKGESYKAPKSTKDYAGIVVSLSRFQHPDMSGFNDEEIWWKMNEEYHVGMVLKSNSRTRILELLDDYAQRIFNDFHASAPVPDKPMH